MPTKGIENVATVRSRRKSAVFSGKAIEDISEKKKALRPNAASGKAVAEPL